MVIIIVSFSEVMPVAVADRDACEIVFFCHRPREQLEAQSAVSVAARCERLQKRSCPRNFCYAATRFYLLDCCCGFAAMEETSLPPLCYWRV